ncbi:uncharacterized protein [Hemitrygon akajei]|uniref:uncharacterized protein n=1 Tax=Hemitrygon akajei TaxID=2704970 RepID=UPI003BF968E4
MPPVACDSLPHRRHESDAGGHGQSDLASDVVCSQTRRITLTSGTSPRSCPLRPEPDRGTPSGIPTQSGHIKMKLEKAVKYYQVRLSIETQRGTGPWSSASQPIPPVSSQPNHGAVDNDYPAHRPVGLWTVWQETGAPGGNPVGQGEGSADGRRWELNPGLPRSAKRRAGSCSPATTCSERVLAASATSRRSEGLDSLQRKGLERSLQAAERRHERRLRDLAGVVEGLEGELREARTDVGRQARKHQLLLNTKMRLEGEIARYRGLLEGEEGSLAATGAVGPRSSHTWLRQKTVTLPSAIVMEASLEQRIETATTQEIPGHGVESESPKAPSKVQTEKMDELIKGWECSFFKDNPHLRKKSASLRFDLHLAAAEGGSPPGKRGALPDIELRLVMRKSSSIPSLKS